MTKGEGGTWAQVEWGSDEESIRFYQRPVYRYEYGLPESILEEEGVVSDEDGLLLFYTGELEWFLPFHLKTTAVFRSLLSSLLLH